MKILPIACLAALVSVSVRAWAQEDTLTAQQIVDKALERNSFGFDNAVAKLTLVLTSKRGSERHREIEIRSMTKSGQGKSLVRFHAPADVAGTGFLVLENPDREDDQYLFLPALGKVKRITGGQRDQRFMGTDLTYADLESRNLRKATSRRLPDGEVGKNPTYVIESVPQSPEDSSYGKTISHIHKTSFVPLKVEFFDKKMEPLKVLTVKRLEKRDGQWIVMDSIIENSQAGTGTRMTVNSLDLNAKLSDSEFTESALKGG